MSSLPVFPPDPAPQPANICAVFVTYHPEPHFAAHVATLRAQVARVLIVDNHSNPAALARLRALRDAPAPAGGAPVELIENADNLGIATALNQGARRALELGYAWLLSMDQDSVPGADMVAELARVRGLHPQPQRVKLIGSNYFNAELDEPAVVFGAEEPDYRRADAVITSGALLSLAAFRAAGPFRDDFFIDSVDNEYALRLAARGQIVLTTRKTLMTHAIGRPQRWKLLGRHPILTRHPPLRRYYIARNRIAVAKGYWRRAPGFVGHEMVRLAGDFVMVLREEGRWTKVGAMLLGVAHGLRGRLGKMREDRWGRGRDGAADERG